jgi:hypothetical protein
LGQLDIRGKRIASSEQGSAVLVVVILIAIMMVYLASNVVSMNVLTSEIKLIEHSQQKRLAASVTNHLALPLTNRSNLRP